MSYEGMPGRVYQLFPKPENVEAILGDDVIQKM